MRLLRISPAQDPANDGPLGAHNTPACRADVRGAKRLNDFQLTGSCELRVQAREVPVAATETHNASAAGRASRKAHAGHRGDLEEKVEASEIRERKLESQPPEIPGSTANVAERVADVLTLCTYIPVVRLTHPLAHTAHRRISAQSDGSTTLCRAVFHVDTIRSRIVRVLLNCATLLPALLCDDRKRMGTSAPRACPLSPLKRIVRVC